MGFIKLLFGAVLILGVYDRAYSSKKTLKFKDIFNNSIVTSKYSSHQVLWGDDDQIIQIETFKNQTHIKIIDPKDPSKQRVFSSGLILQILRDHLGLTHITNEHIQNYMFSPQQNYILFSIHNDFYLFHTKSCKIKRLTFDAQRKDCPQFSPDESSIAYVEANNLWMLDIKSVRTYPLTHDGHSSVMNGKLDWVYQEEIFGRGRYHGYWWSPDSRSLVFLRFDESQVENVSIIDHTDMGAKIVTYPYPRPGGVNPKVTVGHVYRSGGPIRWLPLGSYKREDYLVVGLSFTPDSKSIMYQIQDRKQSWLDLNVADLKTLTKKLVFREQSQDWVDRLQEGPSWGSSDRFYWLSDQGAHSSIVQYTLRDSKVDKETLISTKYGRIKEILFVGPHKLYFMANFKNFIEDHLYAYDFETGESHQLTEDHYSYKASISPNGRYLILDQQDIIKPYGQKLYSVQDETLNVLKDISIPDTTKLDALDLKKPTFYDVKTRDGFSMKAVMIKPKNFDPHIKYPVLIYTYSGPGAQSVSNKFNARTYLWHQFMANKGYIVWICDNRSASGQGHEFEASSFQDFGSQELKDIEDGVGFLKTFKWIDGERIGIWGWSFGGFMSAYALTHSRIFKVGISVAPVTDWNLYDSVYTERYMGFPENNIEGYEKSSILLNSDQLKGKFLLIHGTMDDNVLLHNSLSLSYELQKRNKNFEHILYPQSKHGMNKKVHKDLFYKMTKFIEKKL